MVGSVSIVGDVVDLAAFQFSLSWDPSVVTVVDVEVSEGLGSVNYFVDTEDGVLNVNWFDVSGVSGDFFYVVNVTFQRASSAFDGIIGRRSPPKKTASGFSFSKYLKRFLYF